MNYSKKFEDYLTTKDLTFSDNVTKESFYFNWKTSTEFQTWWLSVFPAVDVETSITYKVARDIALEAWRQQQYKIDKLENTIECPSNAKVNQKVIEYLAQNQTAILDSNGDKWYSLNPNINK
jgi:hypothetical protein